MLLHIIQARSTSTRLPNKILQKIGDKTLLEWHLENTVVNRPRGAMGTTWNYDESHKTVLAIPFKDPKEKEIKKIAKKYNVEVFNPDCNENDVLKRFVIVSKKFSPDWIVRTTADCMMDRSWFMKIVSVSTLHEIPTFNTYKEGSCTEVFKYSDLLRADSELQPYGEYAANGMLYSEAMFHREHCTSYFKKGFTKDSIDTPEEMERARKKYGNSKR